MGNKQAAVELAETGLAVFPCEEAGPLKKRPKPGVLWKQASGPGRDRVDTLWASYNEALPGIDLGKAGYIVIDCDCKDDRPSGVDAFAALCEAQGYDLSQVPQVTTPSGGLHFYFRQIQTDIPHGNGVGDLRHEAARVAGYEQEASIDVRGSGGYVIGPGSRFTDDGARYELAGDVDLHEAPLIPDWLLTRLKAPKPGKGINSNPMSHGAFVPAQPHLQISSNNDARTRAYIEKAMTDEIQELSTAVSGTRNQTLNDAALKLGHYVGSGLLSEQDVRQALLSACIACGLAKDDGLRQCEATINSGLRKGIAEPKGVPDETQSEHAVLGAAIAANLLPKPTMVELEDGSLADAQTGEVIEPQGELKPSPVLDGMPPGLVGDLAQWICDTARRPHPALAIAASLTIIGTLAGRNFATPTRSGTHLYILGLAVTGSGKDHALQQIKRVLRAVNCSHHLGPSEFASMTGVVNMLTRKPLALCPMDEFGAYLKRINSRRASAFESSISKLLRTLWGSSFQDYTTPEWAGREFQTVMAPAVSLYGVSTHEEFYSSMEGGSIEDGTLNRFTLFDCGRSRPADRDPLADPSHLPPTLRNGLRGLYEAGDQGIAVGLRNAPESEPIPNCLAWGEGAQNVFQAYQGDIERQGDKVSIFATFHARSAEMALRIATIVALGRTAREVSAQDMAYGIEIASQSGKAMMTGARDYMSDSEHHDNVNRIRRATKQAGGLIKHRDLQRNAARTMRARDLKDAINTLVEAEEIAVEMVERPSGPPTQAYRLID